MSYFEFMESLRIQRRNTLYRIETGFIPFSEERESVSMNGILQKQIRRSPLLAPSILAHILYQVDEAGECFLFSNVLFESSQTSLGIVLD